MDEIFTDVSSSPISLLSDLLWWSGSGFVSSVKQSIRFAQPCAILPSSFPCSGFFCSCCHWVRNNHLQICHTAMFGDQERTSTCYSAGKNKGTSKMKEWSCQSYKLSSPDFYAWCHLWPSCCTLSIQWCLNFSDKSLQMAPDPWKPKTS